MLEPAVGDELEQCRAALVADMRDRLGRYRIDGLDQLAVMLRGPDAMAARQLGDGAISRLARVERRIDRVEIVLADEEDGQPVHGREVDALVEHAGLGRRVAEEDDGDCGAVLQHRTERGADADRDRAADDRHAAEEIDRQVDQMHRAALARGAAVDLAIELGEHGAQIAALADIVRVRAVRADDVVFQAQVPAYAGGDGLLADAEMGGAAHVALAGRAPGCAPRRGGFSAWNDRAQGAPPLA